MESRIRKLIVEVDETRMRGSRTLSVPDRRSLAIAVVANPAAGGKHDGLQALQLLGAELVALLNHRCIEALGIDASDLAGHGCGVIVGDLGEDHHARAVLDGMTGTNAVDVSVRTASEAVAYGAALGATIEVRLQSEAPEVESDDLMEARVGDAPRHDELLVALLRSSHR